MAVSTIDKQMHDYWQLLGLEEKKSILSYIKYIVSASSQKEFSKTLTIEEYNKEISAAEARINAGQFTLHEDVMRESESWI